MAAEIDTADRAIIDQLQIDGRRSYGRIGEAVGLSEGAVRQRVGRLLRSEAIRIVAVIDPETLGFRHARDRRPADRRPSATSSAARSRRSRRSTTWSARRGGSTC